MKNDDSANVFEKMKQSSGPYQDVSFPADNSSLWWNASDSEWTTWYAENWPKSIESWKRAFDIKKWSNNKEPSSLWGSKGILPAGIAQGGLGDCWWMAVASALAEHPERIKKIFSNVD